MRDYEKYFVELDKMVKKYGENTVLFWQNGKFLEIYGYYYKSCDSSHSIYNKNYNNFNLAVNRMELQVTRGKYSSTLDFIKDGKTYTIDGTGPPIGNFEKFVNKLLKDFNVVIYIENNIVSDYNNIVTSKDADKYLKYADEEKAVDDACLLYTSPSPRD